VRALVGSTSTERPTVTMAMPAWTPHGRAETALHGASGRYGEGEPSGKRARRLL